MSTFHDIAELVGFSGDEPSTNAALIAAVREVVRERDVLRIAVASFWEEMKNCSEYISGNDVLEIFRKHLAAKS